VKSISPGTVTIGVLAIVLGLVGVYVARRAMEPQPIVDRRDPPPQLAKPGPTVVTAGVNLPAKTRITYRDLSVQRLPSGEERPEGAIADVDEIIGRITKEPIRAGTFLTDAPLYGIGEGPNPADLIPAGHVALPITVTGSHVEHGLIRMGSRVNIAGTIESDELANGLVRTKTILDDVLVIATGKEDFELPSPNLSGRQRRELQSTQGRNQEQITVAVTPEQRNKLITAQTFGTISVALNSFDGVQPTGDDEVDVAQIWDFEMSEEVVPVKHEPAPPRVHRVQRWNGNKMEVIEFPAEVIDESRNATFTNQQRNGGTVPVNIDSSN